MDSIKLKNLNITSFLSGHYKLFKIQKFQEMKILKIKKICKNLFVWSKSPDLDMYVNQQALIPIVRSRSIVEGGVEYDTSIYFDFKQVLSL